MNTSKKRFAEQLNSALLRFYGGEMPSLTTISRDFTLRAPDLPPISSETIRQWLKGESMPHLSRIQVLIGWLGEGVGNIHSQTKQVVCLRDDEQYCHHQRQLICQMLGRLQPHETQAMMSILGVLTQLTPPPQHVRSPRNIQS